MLFGVTIAGAQTPVTAPTPTLPSGSSGATTTVAPATTVAPSPTTTAPGAQILPAPTTTSPPAPQTRILGVPQDPKAATSDGGPAGAGAAAGTGAPSTTVAQPPAAPAVSLTPGQVDSVLSNQVKSGASSTAALIDALKPLQNLGMTAQEAAALGMGQFPVQGLANWTDDFGDPRDGPPPHPHEGNDLFTQFDTPVRAPADGTVRYETGGLGGLAAYVTTADGTYYYMAHLDSFATDLSNGAAVTQGRIVGFAGDTGNAKGGPPHVHFEIHPRGGPAVDPKPIIDGWVAAALAKVPELIASFQPAAAAPSATGDGGTDGGIPQILVTTGMTRRFSAPSVPMATPAHVVGTGGFDRAVLGPLTPPALAPLFDGPKGD
ncbi:MAG TPA: M23 family metallopeptidase [Acidimicrobiales bacterium]|jgi:murein DD-endopeptidase MepM/ murein hydrolase activator NlpD|nr:M23 family metallopeptidase [Acidimicrobiales bacterium]